jgi:hypothetical protein
MRSNVPSLDLTRARLARALPSAAHGARAAPQSPLAMLEEIRSHAANGRVFFIPRVLDRAGGIQPAEIRQALRNLKECDRQDNGRWRVRSTDLSGREISVVTVIQEEGLVVTALEGGMP